MNNHQNQSERMKISEEIKEKHMLAKNSSEKESNNMKLLKEMEKDFEKSETVVEMVDETLARVVDLGIKAQINRNLANELSNKYLRPENCEALRVLKINKELWNTSSFVKAIKEQDKAFQTAQKYINQGLAT